MKLYWWNEPDILNAIRIMTYCRMSVGGACDAPDIPRPTLFLVHATTSAVLVNLQLHIRSPLNPAPPSPAPYERVRGITPGKIWKYTFLYMSFSALGCRFQSSILSLTLGKQKLYAVQCSAQLPISIGPSHFHKIWATHTAYGCLE